jgi:hypothetical protein
LLHLSLSPFSALPRGGWWALRRGDVGDEEVI